MNWSPQSLDLNFIKAISFILPPDRKWNKRQPTYMKMLQNVLQQAQRAVPEADLKKLRAEE